ncbi:MAG: RNA 2',3'-cyclic phosphodiesterase [Candidatus Harrisonbacteria bacterium CG10_big_fil_rev_8_21_14_0_10_49_15]|uniref:RNA 2',3'-cyclic phosphodiesterase n=1 Tax=Candidatus Harrisonbacteria bacterium CG10_big_fil_rev_8_21_14_0_10_49_15 TaxID=1974587 RepID=A0A2H0UK80_9BACT|nr:MAG: RNA 2',3'-cyclic phosphodiesterase [Candidatus Harrisonbacteria bacterium CG10_big_fil_rev_8_21_14_0_10_49_15]
MSHRLFISLPFPNSFRQPVARVLGSVEAKLLPDIFRFVDPDLWHTTLLFLGDQEEENLADIVSAIQDAVDNFSGAFESVFEKIDYGPERSNPKMLWLWGSQALSQGLEELRDELQDSLIAYGVPFAPDNRRFTAHITLARLRQGFEGQARSKREKLLSLPEINKSLSVPALVDEIQLVESVLTPAGSEYTVFGTFQLGA